MANRYKKNLLPNHIYILLELLIQSPENHVCSQGSSANCSPASSLYFLVLSPGSSFSSPPPLRTAPLLRYCSVWEFRSNSLHPPQSGTVVATYSFYGSTILCSGSISFSRRFFSFQQGPKTRFYLSCRSSSLLPTHNPQNSMFQNCKRDISYSQLH